MFNAETVRSHVLEGRLSYKRAVYLFERFLLLEAIKKFKGNKAATARFFNFHVNTVRYKFKRIMTQK
jgi:DNA-binding NtrC family response regulator